MSVLVEDEAALSGAFADIHQLLDLAQATELTSLVRDDLLNAWRDLERTRSRLASVEHQLIAEVEQRSLGFELGAKSTAGLARQILRITAPDATGRVKAACDAGPRRTVVGEPLAPVFPHVAAAQAAGLISPRHAYIITTTIKALPDELRDRIIDEGPNAGQLANDVLEAAFVAEAEVMDPTQLARRAREVVDRLDPDGKFRDRDYRERRRELSMTKRADGSGKVTIEGTAELMELLDVVMDSLAAPKPVDGTRDTRTAGQRQHDALLECLHRVTKGGLPEAGGCPATIVVHIGTEDYLSGAGLARTGHGRTVPAADALAWAGGDPRLLTVALSDMHEVTHYSGSHRLFTATQRWAMAARDRGCTFPHCDAAPGWCEAMHVTDYQFSGRTSIDDGALGCKIHHRQAVAQGWQLTMINAVPHWIPPRWLDFAQEPQRNTMFDDPPDPLGSDP